MRKKFVKVMLLGALAFSATTSMVSCKDYDDDVDGLKTSIAATNADLATKAAALDASIGNLKSAQTALQTAIAKATADAEKAALMAKEQAIAASLATMTQMKTELTALIDANTGDIVTLNAKAKDAETKLSTLQGELDAIQKMLGGYADLVKAVGDLQSAVSRIDGVASSLETLGKEVKEAYRLIGEQEKTLKTQAGAILALENLTGTQDETLATVQNSISELLLKIQSMQETLDEASTKEALEAVAKDVSSNKEAISELSKDIDGKLNVLKGLFRSMVTGINFTKASNRVFDLIVAEANKDYVFGEKVTGAITFKKGDKYTYTAATLIQVSPSTANISSDMLAFVRSDGKSLSSDFVQFEVKAYNEPITRGASKGGLWEVSVKLNAAYDKAAFDKFIKNETNNSYLFAIAAKDIAPEAEGGERIVASPYELTFSGNGNYVPMTNIAGTTVNGTQIGLLPAVLPVEIGKAIEIKVQGNNKGARASYIVLNGTDAEKAEWKTYGITGVDQVTTVNTIALNIANAKADGQTVKFKVYAIDFSGNVESTETFSVVCGKQNAAAPSLKATLKPSAAAADNFYAMLVPAPMSSALATTDDDAKNLQGGSYYVEFKDDKGVAIMSPWASLYKANGASSVLMSASIADIKAITAVQMHGIDLQKITDNGSITGKIVFKNVNGLEVLVVPVTLTKEMPAFPATFSAKSGLLSDGVITVYPTFVSGGKATYDYVKIFNGIVSSGNPYHTIGYADAKVNEGNKVNFNNAPIAYTQIAVDNSLVGSQYKKAIPAMVSYNYGEISSVKNATTSAFENWVPVWKTAFGLKFASIPEDSKLTVKSIGIAYPAQTAKIEAKDITFISAVDKSNLGLAVKGDVKTIEMKTRSNGNKVVNEYYTAALNSAGDILFNKVSDQASLKVDVPSTLIITITDVFGNKFDREFAFTVKANQ